MIYLLLEKDSFYCLNQAMLVLSMLNNFRLMKLIWISSLFLLTVLSGCTRSDGPPLVWDEYEPRYGCSIRYANRSIPSLVYISQNYYDRQGNNPELLLEKIQLAIDKGCRLDEVSYTGLTALHVAILHTEPALVQLLIANEADPCVEVQVESSAAYNMQAKDLARWVMSNKRNSPSEQIYQQLSRLPVCNA